MSVGSHTLSPAAAVAAAAEEEEKEVVVVVEVVFVGFWHAPGAGIMETDDRQVTTVFTVQPSFHNRHSTN